MTGDNPNIRDNFLGAWRLLSYESHDAAGNTTYPFGRNINGLLMYDRSGMMSVQIIRGDRPDFPTEDMFGADADVLKTAFEGLNTYFGTFEIDSSRSIVTHRLQGASMPNRTGSQQVREYEFYDNRLSLKTPSRLMDGKMLTGLLVWEKIEHKDNQ